MILYVAKIAGLVLGYEHTLRAHMGWNTLKLLCATCELSCNMKAEVNMFTMRS